MRLNSSISLNLSARLPRPRQLGTRPGQPRGASCRQIIASSKVSHALLPSLAHAREDSAAQRDGRLGGAITFWESTQAPSKKEHTSGQHPITLEATEEHGGKY